MRRRGFKAQGLNFLLGGGCCLKLGFELVVNFMFLFWILVWSAGLLP